MTYRQSLRIILTGSVVAQSISILGGWLLARWLYTPAQYGHFAWVWSMTWVLSLLLTGTYENYIVSAHSDDEAAQLSHKACYNAHRASILCFAGTLVALFLVPDQEVSPPWWTIAPMAWILALINIRIQTYSRAHQDKRLSVLRVTQSAAVLTAQIVLGLLYVETGLIFGSLAGLLVVLFRVWPPKESLKKPQNASVVNVWQQQARKMQPSILLNVAYLHLQPVLINALFGAHVTGLFTLTQRLVQAPAQMLMGAIRLVWQREAKQHQQTGPGAFFAFYRQSVTRLAWQLALPVLLLCGLGAQIIEPLFGSRWLGMADILIWLGFAAAAQAMFSPVSGIIDLTKKATISLWLNLWFIFGVAAAWIAGYAYGRFNLGLQLMTWVIIFGYMASVFYFWQLLKLAAQDHKQHDKLD